MTAYLIVSLAALLAAGLTMYSGFGLGTLLLPVFALFFPAEVAVVATALVHGANNVFKASLLGRFADRAVVRLVGWHDRVHRSVLKLTRPFLRSHRLSWSSVCL